APTYWATARDCPYILGNREGLPLHIGQPRGIAPTYWATARDCPYILGNRKGLPLLLCGLFYG
ncbi:MAG: hypothetical protein ACPGWR_21580, partial [Ardenticatenaceae bacterium]